MTGTPSDGDRTGEPIPLRTNQEPLPSKPSRRPGKIHGLATTGMAASAIVGILAGLAFITVGWPGSSGRYIVGVIIAAAMCFLVCGAFAVLAAARDTYARPPEDGH